MSDKQFVSIPSKLEIASINEAVIPKVTGFENSGLTPLAELTACISKVDYLNANGFYIPRKEFQDMIDVNKEYIKNGKSLVMIAHDERPYSDLDVRDRLIVGIIKDVWIEPDGNVFAKTTIANTDAGKDIIALCLAGLGIQASTRLGILPQKDPETSYDSMVGKESILYGYDLVLDPAIESTWLEFKAASKSKNSKVLNKDTKVSNKVDIDTYSMELSYNINKVKEALAYEQEKNRILKGNK